MKERKEIRIRAAGMIDNQDLICDGMDSFCGDISHGLGMRLSGSKCGFVVSFEDFERVYFAAKKLRDSK
jgi:hypothetical protein